MKQFFKNVAATIIGIFASGIIMMILGFICLMAWCSMAAASLHWLTTL